MTKLAYPCIGGPLDGEYATLRDFTGKWSSDLKSREDGMYEHLWPQYHPFNTARRGSTVTNVVFLHESLLKPQVKARAR